MRNAICDAELKWAVPSARPPLSITLTAAPGVTPPLSVTSLEKIQGCPEATRPAPLALTRTVSIRYRICISRAMRCSVEGCVENSRIMDPPLNGLMMNMWAVAGEASMGMRLDQFSSFCKAETSP